MAKFEVGHKKTGGRAKGATNKIDRSSAHVLNFLLQSFGCLKSGDCYVYGHSFDGDILYIGKGRGSRAWSMQKGARNDDWVNYVEKHGKPEIVMFAIGLSEEEALAIESVLIKLRNPLLNIMMTRPAAQRSIFDNN